MTSPALSDSRLANIAARSIRDSWTVLADRFRIITRRAKLRFEERDWSGMAADHLERLELYNKVSTETAATVRSILDVRAEDRYVWMGMKAVYSGLIADRADSELAETFFNSVTRKIFATVGVDNRIEFVDTDYDIMPPDLTDPIFDRYEGGEPAVALIRRIIDHAGFDGPFRHLDEDCEMVASRVEGRLRRVGGLRTIDRVDMVSSVFFRGKGAYLVGRISSGSQVVPLVLALLHGPEGIGVDAVLLTENQVSILFSFARSYFHVDVARPGALVHFLSTLMPRKRRSEIYISIGQNKHGKTELYRELKRHIAFSGERFEVARGVQGLVMVVFTLPGFDVVVKVIKDRFGAPKQMTRADVMSKYRLVFRRDRAGRLVDAQEFEHLEFPTGRFDKILLELLVEHCGRTVSVSDEAVHLAHAYVERRVTPLDVFLSEAEPDAAEAAVVDYGLAIKDMAATGIFPGDMLLKNFGVTRHGRVVFYDYDELTTLDQCVFRKLPLAGSIDDEMAAEPWFSVGPDDVFPEEFATFLGLTGRLRDVFLARHVDLFTADAWNAWKRRVKAGELIEIYPYHDDCRLSSV